MIKARFRFFKGDSADHEIVELEGRDAWDIQDQLDALWDQDDRNNHWDAVEDYFGPLEG